VTPDHTHNGQADDLEAHGANATRADSIPDVTKAIQATHSVCKGCDLLL